MADADEARNQLMTLIAQLEGEAVIRLLRFLWWWRFGEPPPGD